MSVCPHRPEKCIFASKKRTVRLRKKFYTYYCRSQKDLSDDVKNKFLQWGEMGENLEKLWNFAQKLKTAYF